MSLIQHRVLQFSVDSSRPYDAVTFRLPSRLQAFAGSDYEGTDWVSGHRSVWADCREVGQIIQQTDGQLLEPTDIDKLDFVSASHCSGTLHTYKRFSTRTGTFIREKTDLFLKKKRKGHT